MALPDVEMTVLGVRVELPAHQPLVLLQDPGTGTVVPIWIGSPEASVIAQFQQGIRPLRPMTQDLVVELIQVSGLVLEQVRISHVEDAVFHAQLVLSNGVRVDARASDAIACGLLAEVPILCAAEVLERAGVELDEEEAEDDLPSPDQLDSEAPPTGPAADAELDAFRRFLDSVDPEDFSDPRGPGASF